MNKFPWLHLLVGVVGVLASASIITVIVNAVFGLEKEDPGRSVLLLTGLLGMVYGQAFGIKHGVKNQLNNRLGLAVAWYAGAPLGALLCGIFGRFNRHVEVGFPIFICESRQIAAVNPSRYASGDPDHACRPFARMV